MPFLRNKFYSFLFCLCIAGASLLYWALHASAADFDSAALCFFKRITSIPCPSCGVTRSSMSIFRGDFSTALHYNPLGFLATAFICIAPVWMLADLFLKKDSLLKAYLSTERYIQKPILAYPLITLILSNWIWNIFKQL